MNLQAGQKVHGLSLSKQLWEDELVSVWGARNDEGCSVLLRILKSPAWAPGRLQRCLDHLADLAPPRTPLPWAFGTTSGISLHFGPPGPAFEEEMVAGVPLSLLLSEMAAENRAMPVAAALEIGIQLCDTLSTLHAHERAGHGGVMPRLVVIDFAGKVRLAGYGLGHYCASLDRGFAAPEVHLDPGRRRPTPAGDVFSLGALLFAMVVGRPMFTGTPEEMENVGVGTDPSLFVVPVAAAHLPLTPVVEQCLDSSPEERLSIDALRRELVAIRVPEGAELLRELVAEHQENFEQTWAPVATAPQPSPMPSPPPPSPEPRAPVAPARVSELSEPSETSGEPSFLSTSGSGPISMIESPAPVTLTETSVVTMEGLRHFDALEKQRQLARRLFLAAALLMFMAFLLFATSPSRTGADFGAADLDGGERATIPEQPSPEPTAGTGSPSPAQTELPVAVPSTEPSAPRPAGGRSRPVRSTPPPEEVATDPTPAGIVSAESSPPPIEEGPASSQQSLEGLGDPMDDPAFGQGAARPVAARAPVSSPQRRDPELTGLLRGVRRGCVGRRNVVNAPRGSRFEEMELNLDGVNYPLAVDGAECFTLPPLPAGEYRIRGCAEHVRSGDRRRTGWRGEIDGRVVIPNLILSDRTCR